MTDYETGPASIHAMNAMAQQIETFGEKQHRVSRTLPTPKRLFKGAMAFDTVFLKSALFRAAIGPRAVYNERVQVPAHGDNRVFFTGEELRQDDQRVLLALIKMRFGLVVDHVIQFSPREFARDVLKWADSGDSVAKLKACIKRLRKAAIEVSYDNGSEGSYSFVTDYEMELDDRRWSVWLSPRLVTMFERANPTFIDTSVRFKLGDSLASWLMGFVSADACFVDFKTSDLRDWSGQTGYEQKAFNRRLKAELEKLVTEGVIRSFSFAGTKMHIYK